MVQPSAMYSYAVHPRFGRIRAVTAFSAVDQGVEITDYKYQLAKAPTWSGGVSNLVNTLNMPPEQVEEQHKRCFQAAETARKKWNKFSDLCRE